MTLAACLTLWGCDEWLAVPTDAQVIDAYEDPTSVAGRWQITGDGEMSGCEDAQLNTQTLQLAAAPFEVVQVDERLEGRHLPQPAEGQFTFERGVVRGERVEFTTVEETPQAAIAIEFSGRVDALGRIAGRFVGIGPDQCKSRGSFLVTIE